MDKDSGVDRAALGKEGEVKSGTRHQCPTASYQPSNKMVGRGDHCSHHDEIAEDLLAFFGEDVIRRLLDGIKPGWESDLRTVRERHACHVNDSHRATSLTVR